MFLITILSKQRCTVLIELDYICIQTKFFFSYILVEKYLSQISVYNQIRGAIDGSIGASLMFDISYTTDRLRLIAKRNGPAFTVTVETIDKFNFCCRKTSEELFRCDFTFALYSPKFPLCGQGKISISNCTFSERFQFFLKILFHETP